MLLYLFRPAVRRSKAISTFKRTSSIRVLLLNTQNASAGTNIIEATSCLLVLFSLFPSSYCFIVLLFYCFIVLLFYCFIVLSNIFCFIEPYIGTDIKEVEAQAVARAVRQGQTSQVTVVRYYNSIIPLLFFFHHFSS